MRRVCAAGFTGDAPLRGSSRKVTEAHPARVDASAFFGMPKPPIRKLLFIPSHRIRGIGEVRFATLRLVPLWQLARDAGWTLVRRLRFHRGWHWGFTAQKTRFFTLPGFAYMRFYPHPPCLTVVYNPHLWQASASSAIRVGSIIFADTTTGVTLQASATLSGYTCGQPA